MTFFYIYSRTESQTKTEYLHVEQIMGSEYSEATSTPPKLSLFYSLPVYTPTDPPGMLTPPINSAVSVPFQWEEAPGKPRPCDTQSNPSKDVDTDTNIVTAPRCLELPPRLLSEATYCRVSSVPSPTTVLDGPDFGRPTRFSLSFSRGGSFRAAREGRLSRRALFGSGRWGSFRKSNGAGGHHQIVSGGGFDSPPSAVADGGTSVKITRVRRRGSFLRLSHQAGTNVLTNIYEGLKQVVPWRRGHEKVRKGGF